MSNTHNMSFNDTLDQLRVYFQSEIDSLNEKVSNCPASRQNGSPPQDGIAPDLTELLKENQDLQRRLREIESKYKNLKTEAKIINDENKSLITALRLLNDEFSPQDGSNLHPPPGEVSK